METATPTSELEQKLIAQGKTVALAMNFDLDQPNDPELGKIIAHATNLARLSGEAQILVTAPKMFLPGGERSIPNLFECERREIDHAKMPAWEKIGSLFKALELDGETLETRLVRTPNAQAFVLTVIATATIE